MTYTRRNVQVSPSASPAHSPPPSTDQWKCPHCPYIQHNRRVPDFRRHVRTHTRSADEVLWACCGVPVGEALARGVPEDVVREEPFEFGGKLMVGGCRKTFSRRDALTRHLRREEGRCYGDAFADYQPGNNLGVGEGF
ncbi:hypothetical protein C8Q76DRAFT_840245 [Earliella scabrosa]|nr:hypothetical protein C8Q76DRAFT_840245 [Earliella scabrosa]